MPFGSKKRIQKRKKVRTPTGLGLVFYHLWRFSALRMTKIPATHVQQQVVEPHSQVLASSPENPYVFQREMSKYEVKHNGMCSCNWPKKALKLVQIVPIFFRHPKNRVFAAPLCYCSESPPWTSLADLNHRNKQNEY